MLSWVGCGEKSVACFVGHPVLLKEEYLLHMHIHKFKIYIFMIGQSTTGAVDRLIIQSSLALKCYDTQSLGHSVVWHSVICCSSAPPSRSGLWDSGYRGLGIAYNTRSRYCLQYSVSLLQSILNSDFPFNVSCCLQLLVVLHPWVCHGHKTFFDSAFFQVYQDPTFNYKHVNLDIVSAHFIDLKLKQMGFG